MRELLVIPTIHDVLDSTTPSLVAREESGDSKLVRTRNWVWMRILGGLASRD